MVPRPWKGSPSSNLLSHQGRCVQLFRLHTAQDATSQGMPITLWTSSLFKKHFRTFIIALLMLKMGRLYINYVNFLSDGYKVARSYKISVMQLSQLFLMAIIKFLKSSFCVQ